MSGSFSLPQLVYKAVDLYYENMHDWHGNWMYKDKFANGSWLRSW